MLSLRLKAIASFVEKDDRVADVGCDHGYLAIHLIKNELCQKVIATDIHKNALENAKQNILKNHLEEKISVYEADGLLQVSDKDINTLILSGMGTETILHILSNLEGFTIDKMILQSNNHLDKLRFSLKKMGYYLQEESVVYEKKHYYVVGVYTKEKKRLTYRDFLFGLYDKTNQKYYSQLYADYLAIYKKIDIKKIKDKFKWKGKLFLLKKYL